MLAAIDFPSDLLLVLVLVLVLVLGQPDQFSCVQR
jgi:hypothetical protein